MRTGSHVLWNDLTGEGGHEERDMGLIGLSRKEQNQLYSSVLQKMDSQQKGSQTESIFIIP